MLVSISALSGPMYRACIESALALEWPHKLDHLFQVGGDDLPTRQERVWVKYEYARRVMLDMGYDALLTVDSDTIVPPDALSKLWAVEGDVIYGLYTWRRPYCAWNATSLLNKRVKRSLAWDEDDAKKAWGKPVRVRGMGHGCTLFRRRVLEAIPFRVDLGMECHCDWTFSLDCEAQGFVQMCHTGVVCGHIIHGDGHVVSWPDIEGHRLYRWAKLEDSPSGTMTDALVYERNKRAESVEGSPVY